MEKHTFNNSLKRICVYCIIAIMFLLCATLPFTASWLSVVNNSAKTDGTTALPNPTLEFYNSTTKLTDAHTFTAGASGNTTALNIHVKNTSIASGSQQQAGARVLARIFYAIYVDEDVKEIATTQHISSINYGDCIITHEHLPNTYSGYLFVNGAIEPDTYVRLFKSIVVASEGANKIMTLELSGESLLYEGNPYSTGELDKVPWESYPSNWLNLLTWDGDFESYDDDNMAGFTDQSKSTTIGVTTVDDAPVGNKVFRYVSGGNNVRIYRYQHIKQGYNYRFACYYKSTSSINPPLMAELNTNGYSWAGRNSRTILATNSWEYITLETGLLDAQPDNTTSIYTFIRCNTNQTAWFDYVRLERIMGTSTPV